MNFRTIFLLSVFLLLFSCKDYHNEMIHWTNNISIGTSLDSVKRTQPEFIEVDWNNPRIMDNEVYYRITKIKNKHDMLNMDYYLVFIDNKYQGRFAHK